MFRTIYEAADSKLQVFWFCHAGAGSASLVRSARHVSAPVTLNVASLPGREHRFRDGLTMSLDELVDQFFEDLQPRVGAPFVLIGHSFGSLMSYLLAQKLTAAGTPPVSLTVMTLAAPDRVQFNPRTAHLSDEEFLDYLDNRFGSVPKSLRTNPEAIALFLPIVRYDLRLLESYVHQPVQPLPIPLLALAGSRDRAVNAEQMQQWQRFTSDSFALETIAGGHFFPTENVQPIIQRTIERLQ
ncbi:thioesterase II family protein [Rosistilla carotiformis]|nr:alpha/beta fold hydrolase [Rosistilla carotiformis]